MNAFTFKLLPLIIIGFIAFSSINTSTQTTSDSAINNTPVCDCG